ncbi:MAG: type IV pilus inner membrane component PilO [Thermoleophilia bacterium]
MSRRNVYILGGLLLVVILAAHWFLLLSPLRERIADVDQQIATERTQLVQNQAQLAVLERTRLDAQRNEARLIELAKMMPERTELPSLLLQIQDLATESGIEFMTISPGQSIAAGLYQTVPLALQFTGTFFDLNDFIYRAEQMAAGPGRILTVKTLGLALVGEDAANASPSLTVALTLYSFQQALPATVVQ